MIWKESRFWKNSSEQIRKQSEFLDKRRSVMNLEKGTLIWLTGVPASGKSTIATEVEKELKRRGIKVENLDADEIRANLSPDLGYTAEARDINTKRLAFMGKIMARNGVSTLVAAVSSLRQFRDRARDWVDQFVEIHVQCTLEECQKRDPKGLYAKAERGEVNDIAGMHQPYEEPLKPELVLDTANSTVEECSAKVLQKLEELNYIPAGGSNDYSQEDEEKIMDRLKGLGYVE
jgi:adenylyl-sulfate kinase